MAKQQARSLAGARIAVLKTCGTTTWPTGATPAKPSWARTDVKKKLLDFWYKGIIAPLWKLKRLIVRFRDNGRCRYCLDNVSSKTFTVDHILPISAGGTDAFANLACCCKYCNKFKGNTHPVTTEMRNTMWTMAYRRHQHRAACERRGKIYASDT
jgi:hypothetical protein